MAPPLKTDLHQSEERLQEGGAVFIYLISIVAALGGFLFDFPSVIVQWKINDHS